MARIKPPEISGPGGLKLDKKKQERYKKLIAKGYRTVHCPNCGEPYTAKNIVEVVVCNKCGYGKANVK